MNPNDIPTPRTDERCGIYGYDDAVSAHFARTLEHENVKLKEENLVLKGCAKHPEIWQGDACIGCLEDENTRLKEEIKDHLERHDGRLVENIRLKEEAELAKLAYTRAAGERKDLQSRLTETEKMVVGLRNALEAQNKSCWAIANRSPDRITLATRADELYTEALSQVPQSLAQKFVKREEYNLVIQSLREADAEITRLNAEIGGAKNDTKL